MKLLCLFSLLTLISKKIINCGSTPCFEYSCDECDSPEYGRCTKCRDTWTLVDGTCPCSDDGCALCYSGLAGYNLCQLCKDGYYRNNNDCYCQVENCEHCSENGCLKCSSGYYYNETLNKCEKEQEIENIECYDQNCDSCFSEEKGACENCKEGYVAKKGECNELPLVVNGTCPPKHVTYDGKYCVQECEGIECTILNFNFFTFFLTCSSNECLVCTNNQILFFSQCDNSRVCSVMEGCLNCKTNDECIICNQGYYLLGGLCHKCINGCASCINNYTCNYCMSGYELTPDKQCNFTNRMDFAVSTYSVYKEQMIKIYHPEEVPATPAPTNIKTTVISEQTSLTNSSDPYGINVQLIMECPSHCEKCYDSNGKCLECERLYQLKDNKCIRHCSDEKCTECYLEEETEICSKCEDNYLPNKNKCELICSDEYCSKCSMIGDLEFCISCKNGYKLKNDRCVIKCDDENCKTCSNNRKNCTECELGKKLFEGRCAVQNSCSQYFPNCNYCFNSEKCVECLKGYELDSKTNNCKKKSSYATLIFIIIAVSIVIIGVIAYCIYQKKKSDFRDQIRRMRIGQNNEDNVNGVHIYRERSGHHSLDNSGSSRSISKEDLSDEYEKQKKKDEKAKKMCQFCNKKQAKFTCDCGCNVCKEHSALKKVEGENETYKVCFACEKIVKKVTQIKYPCHICFQSKISVAHFKCGCALEVCKECYIKCKLGSDRCPGCRRVI